ncbi:MAG: acyltransferase family protein [Alphaproteobacteria bacterium]|nr:acyltransferase family protein [Alphaproteobacteria bacterium]
MTAPARPVEIKALAGARALPPLLLVLYHYHEGHGYQHWRLFDVFIAKGYLWVEFFFALSGFVLIHVYGARMRQLWTAKSYGEFLRARLARLYPLHIATLFIMLAMMAVAGLLAQWGGYVSFYDAPGYHPYATWQSFIANLFLVQAWHLFPKLSWNGVSWFVSVEFFLCLVFPLFAWIANGGLWRAAVLIFGGLCGLWYMAQVSGHGLDITFDYGVLRGLADFAVGVGLAMLYRAFDGKARDGLSDGLLSGIQLLVVALFLYAIYGTGWSHRPADFWIVPTMAALILSISFDRGIVARALQAKPLLVLGEWSFAIYIGQTTWLQALRIAEARLYPDVAPAWQHAVHIIEPIALVVICAVWGWLLFVLVEKPANGWLRPQRKH